MPYSSTSPSHRRLQQQPARTVDRQQQQSSGSGEFQPRRGQQMSGHAPAPHSSEKAVIQQNVTPRVMQGS